MIYPWQELCVYYLDHDPVQAARLHNNIHARTMPGQYAQLLTSAWVKLHSEYHADWDAQDPYAGILKLWVSPPIFGAPMLTPSPDAGFTTRTGDGPFWLLLGQLLPPSVDVEGMFVRWLTERQGNYRWLYDAAFELCREYQRRTGKRHAAEPYVQTLEVVPPALGSTSPDHTEPPISSLISPGCVVVEGGCIEAVPTYRQYYRELK